MTEAKTAPVNGVRRTPRTEEGTVRIYLAAPAGPSGGRAGLYKLVEDITEEHGNGYDLIGRFIGSRILTEAPIGGVMVRKTPTGSNRYHGHTWALAFVPEDGRSWVWSEPVDARRFLAFRDQVKEALALARGQGHDGAEKQGRKGAGVNPKRGSVNPKRGSVNPKRSGFFVPVNRDETQSRDAPGYPQSAVR